MRGLQPGDDWTALLAGFLVAGVGIGLVNPALATAAVGVVEPQRAGMASGINSTFRQVGIATGIAGARRDLPAPSWRRTLHRRRAPGGCRAAVSGSDAADFVCFGGSASAGNAALTHAAEQRSSAGSTTSCSSRAIVAFVGAVLAAVLTRPSDFVGARAPARRRG